MAETTTTMADQRIPATLAAEVELLLADRGGAMFRSHGAIIYQGDFTDQPSLTKKCPLIGWGGYNRLAVVTEGSSVPDTNITDTSVNLSVALYAKKYSGNAHVALHSKSSIYNDPAAAALDAVMSRDGALVELIAGHSDDWTATTLGTGTAMSVDKFFDAIGKLEAANVPARPGEVFWQGTPSHFRELAEDLRGEQGVMEHQAVTAEMQAIKGDAYRGTLGGVDLFVSTLMVVDTGDTYSQMVARGGLYWADATPKVGPAALGVLVDKVFVEFSRAELTDRTTPQAWLGTARAQDGCGVKILSQT